MKTIFLIASVCFLLFNSHSYAQSPALKFDGIDDYVDLGVNAANSARTIEMWFSLTTSVDPTLQNEILIIGTEVPGQNVNEWHLSITKTGTVNPAGTLRFAYVISDGNVEQVFSDGNTWLANQWYHVTVVIDSIQGMRMYVDGIAQSASASSFVTALSSNGMNVEIGRHAGHNRYFGGKIEDLRISSEVIYSSNFTPPCTDIASAPSTIGLWNFNDNAGTIATDDGPASYHGQIHGASWDSSNVCKPSNVYITDVASSHIEMSPNPSDGMFLIRNLPSTGSSVHLHIYNTRGQAITNKTVTPNQNHIDLSRYKSGIYYYKLIDEQGNYQSGTLLKID